MFLNNIVHHIEHDSIAIDTFLRSTLNEQKKRLADITSTKVDDIRLKTKSYSKTQNVIRHILKEVRDVNFSDNGVVWIIGGEGKILTHPNKNLINKNVSDFYDYYGNQVYESVYKSAGKNDSGFSDYWVDGKNGLISKIIFYKTIPELKLIVVSEIDIQSVNTEVASREQNQILSLNNIIRKYKYKNSGVIGVFNGSKTIIAHPDSEYVGKEISLINNKLYDGIERLYSVERTKSQLENKGYLRTTVKNKIVWIRYLEGYDWYLVLSVDKEELFQAANELKNLIMIAAIIFLVVINFVTLVAVKNITDSVKKLSDVAKNVKSGDLSVRSDILSKNEIGELSTSMNDMIHTIESRTNSLASLNIELKQAKQNAEEATQSKTRFLAAVSHDLLQPLTTAKLFSSVLQLENLSDENADAVAKINNSLEAAQQLISELVDISKLNSGAVQPKIKAFPLHELFDEAKQAFSIQAQNSNIDLKVMQTSISVNSDKQLLRHIINNLVSNAIRYTKKGAVLLGCRRADNIVRIEVWDTGPGIPKSKQQEIFQEFVRVNRDDIGGEQCFGLGLTIVDRIVKIMDYKISLRSEIGKGSVFSVEVPIVQNSSNTKDLLPELRSQTKQISSTELKNKTVLCIENEIDILDGMDRLLSSWGCNTILAASGEEIFEILESEEVHIDIILSDYHLGPNEAGVDVIKQVCQKCGKTIPAIIITAETSESVEDIVFKNSHSLLNKPIDPQTLYQKIIDII